MPHNFAIKKLTKTHWEAVSRIYAEGLATGFATFETKVPSWSVWNDKYIKSCRFVGVVDAEVVGFTVLSKVSQREVYKGVAEVSIYIAQDYRGKGLGKLMLNQLIETSEKEGYWTLVAQIFSENKASIILHEKCGFRVVGTREKLAQRLGKWHDNCLLERRSKLII